MIFLFLPRLYIAYLQTRNWNDIPLLRANSCWPLPEIMTFPSHRRSVMRATTREYRFCFHNRIFDNVSLTGSSKKPTIRDSQDGTSISKLSREKTVMQSPNLSLGLRKHFIVKI